MTRRSPTPQTPAVPPWWYPDEPDDEPAPEPADSLPAPAQPRIENPAAPATAAIPPVWETAWPSTVDATGDEQGEPLVEFGIPATTRSWAQPEPPVGPLVTSPQPTSERPIDYEVDTDVDTAVAAASNDLAEPYAEFGLPDGVEPGETSWAFAPPEIGQFAVRWAIDYLSWDESAPGRRAAALATYAAGGSASTMVSTSGLESPPGRQRATFACAGLVSVTAEGVCRVRVDALVTPYIARGPRSVVSTGAARTTYPQGSRPSSAPAPEATGWRALDSVWQTVIAHIHRGASGDLVILSPTEALAGAAGDGDDLAATKSPDPLPPHPPSASWSSSAPPAPPGPVAWTATANGA